MCPGNDCPIKNKCYRYRAVQDLAQPYFQDIPFDFKNNQCNGFKDIDKTSGPVRHLDDKSWDVIVAKDRSKSNENK
tara:strand:+ start:1111 stop:1338 length:228 start_codon:yes stop_codon:yes gene_type:complete